MKKAYLIMLALSAALGARSEVSSDFESGILDVSTWSQSAGATEFTTEAYTYAGDRPLPVAHMRYLNVVDATIEDPVVVTDNQKIDGTGVYVDTMVKFTSAIDNNFSLAKNDKIAIWTVQEAANGPVKLVALAGKYTDYENTVVPFLYDLTPNGFDAEAWHRLTVKTIELGQDIFGSESLYGFVVYLDGVELSYAGKAKTDAAEYTALDNLSVAAQPHYDATAERNSLLPSLARRVSDEGDFASVSFAGQGDLDDFVVTRTAPDFAAHPLKYTLTWDSGVASIVINNIPVDLAAGSSQIFDLDVAEKTLTITAAFKDGYEAKGWQNGARTVKSGDIISILTSAAFYSVDGVNFPDTNDGRRLAVATAMTNGKTLDLNADYEGRQLYIEYPNGASAEQRKLVLDLKGHTLGPIEAGPTIYVAQGASLTIIDSVGGGKVIASARYGEALRTNGPVAIEAGHFEGNLVCTRGAAAASIVFKGGSVKQAVGADAHFPYLTANGKDAFLNDGVWTIGTATEAIIRVPEVEHATYVVTVNDTPRGANEYDEYRVAFGSTVKIDWTPALGYRIMNGTESQTIDGTAISLQNTQPTVIKPEVELQPYEITYVYQDGEGESVDFEGVNENKMRYTIVEAVTIEPSLITDDTYAVTAISLESIPLGSTGDKEVVVTLAEKSGKSWLSLANAGEATGLDPKLKTVSLKTLAAWADDNDIAVESAPIVRPQAFLFNCANTEAAIEEKTKEFFFTAEDLQTILDGGELTTLNGVEHNGHLTILGSTDLKNWHVKQAGDRFFKGRLTLTEDAE